MAKVICLLLTMEMAGSARGEIIDRIVAVVGGHLITLSDIRTERAIRAVLEEDGPADDNELLSELIDQHIIDLQLDYLPGTEPAASEVEARLNEIKDRKGLSDNAIRNAIREHLRRQRYVAERFRRFEKASDEEVAAYYRDLFIPEAHARGLSVIPPLNDVQELIRGNIIAEKTAEELKKWLNQTRKSIIIEVFK